MQVQSMKDLAAYAHNLRGPLRVATKYPNLAARMLDSQKINYTLISAEGTLEAAPHIGYADIICDLVSSGQTLQDNRLRALSDGLVLRSQAALIGNVAALKNKPAALLIARHLLEYIDAHQRAAENLAVFANMRGESPEAIARLIFTQTSVGGLQGPTISKIITRQEENNWYAVNVIVKRGELFKAINEIRAIGGSGVVVMPVTYIFEEEPPRYTAMLQALQ